MVRTVAVMMGVRMLLPVETRITKLIGIGIGVGLGKTIDQSDSRRYTGAARKET